MSKRSRGARWTPDDRLFWLKGILHATRNDPAVDDGERLVFAVMAVVADHRNRFTEEDAIAGLADPAVVATAQELLHKVWP
ncbi:MAG: hypothetical protein CK431_21315 [Mycobacterium sp.]|nr:MAG: hypothetical protein CK431_21315 [Mycobacterium sp.]